MRKKKIRYLRFNEAVYNEANDRRIRRDSVSYVLETLDVCSIAGETIRISVWRPVYRFLTPYEAEAYFYHKHTEEV